MNIPESYNLSIRHVNIKFEPEALNEITLILPKKIKYYTSYKKKK